MEFQAYNTKIYNLQKDIIQLQIESCRATLLRNNKQPSSKELWQLVKIATPLNNTNIEHYHFQRSKYIQFLKRLEKYES